MSKYPLISKGVGKFTPDLWRRLMDALRFVEQEGPMLQRKQSSGGGRPARAASSVVRVIRLNVPLPIPDKPGQWEYTWSMGAVSTDPNGISTLIIDPNGPSSGSDGYGFAINAEEAFNFTGFPGGTSGYGIPAGPPDGIALAEPLPLKAGTFAGCIFIRREDDDLLIPVLLGASNALAIGCPEPAP